MSLVQLRGVARDALSSRRDGEAAASLWRALLASALALEGFLLALDVVSADGGLLQSISPLVRLWPWLLWPGELVFGNAPVAGSLLPQRGWPVLAIFALLLVGASCVWARVTLLCRNAAPNGRRYLWLALGAAAAMGLTLVLLPSLPSDDVFSYILYGRISAVHGANPLIAVPADFPKDPFLYDVFWRDTRSVYGPVWLGLSSGLAHLAEAFGGSLAVYVLLFKLLGLVAHLVNTLLVWGILSIWAPRRRLFGTLLYAWNPLCLLEFCGSAHNDAVMLCFLLLAVYCLVRRWEVAALVALGLSISTKYVPLALLPFYLAWVTRGLTLRGVPWPRILGAVGWRAGVVAAVMVVTALPYWAGPQTLGSLVFSPPAQQLDNSYIDGIKWPLRWLVSGAFGVPYPRAVALVDTTLKALGLLAFVALWLWEFRRARSLEGVLRAWGWALVWYALVASGWFWPWYITWIVAVVALVPWGRLTVVTLLLAGSVMTMYAFLPMQSSPVYGYRVGVAFGPATIYLLWLWWHERARLAEELRASWDSVRAAMSVML